MPIVMSATDKNLPLFARHFIKGLMTDGVLRDAIG